MKNESLEKYFDYFRKNIVGIQEHYDTPYGKKPIIYADWIASGRLYKPIEKKLLKQIGPYVANTHTETNETGTRMTYGYHKSREIIKNHVNAGEDDILITAGFGMTGVINKLQRIMGLKKCDRKKNLGFSPNDIPERERPVVFVSHMEHHSNHTSWYETICDVVIVPPDDRLLVSPENLQKELQKYSKRKYKIGSFTACSNVTGIQTPYHLLAREMHKSGGVCFIDFAASAPYKQINMHPSDPMEKLDAIFFSPHKFLGGPGSSGVLIFDKSLYKAKAPDQPGGGTVDWTNPWGKYKYVDDIEAREDGGTPGFLQSIRAALAIRLKEEMCVDKIIQRERELTSLALREMKKISQIILLAGDIEERIGCLSFYIESIHYNLIVKLFSDRYGIQVRGGCTCAGTYGHFLLDVNFEKSLEISEKISKGDLSQKPGWIRLSLHPTMTDRELLYIIMALREIIQNHQEWMKDYTYSPQTNEYYHKSSRFDNKKLTSKWFQI